MESFLVTSFPYIATLGFILCPIYTYFGTLCNNTITTTIDGVKYQFYHWPTKVIQYPSLKMEDYSIPTTKVASWREYQANGQHHPPR